MAGWGLMMGLGQSLQTVGGMVSDFNKDKMRQKLEIEREDRAEARDTAKWEREQDSYGGKDRIVDGPNGTLLRVRLNKAGDPMGEGEPISEREAKLIRNQDTIAELGVTAAQQGITKGEQDIEVGKVKVEFARPEAEAGLDRTRAQTDSARASAANYRSATAARAAGGSGTGGGDVRTAGLSQHTIDTYFSERDEDGNVILDEDGKPRTDYAALDEYISSDEFQGAKNENAGAARFMKRRRGEQSAVQADRATRGARGGLSAGELEDFIKTGETPASQNEGLDKTLSSEAGQEQAGVLKHMERLAISAIDAGTKSVDEAAQELEAAGFPRAARRLRGRYGK